MYHSLQILDLLLIQQFGDYATEIADIAHYEAASFVGALRSMSATITSTAISENLTFPYVTVPHFEVHGVLNNNVSKAMQVSFAPLIKHHEKTEWESYASLNQGWIDEGLALGIGSKQQHVKNGTSMAPISPWIHQVDKDGKKNIQMEQTAKFGPWSYAPVWQQAPAPEDHSIVNFDLLSHPTFERVFQEIWESHEPTISEALQLEFLYGGAIQDDATHPHSFLASPVFASFGSHDKTDLVGAVVATVAWDNFLSNILHEGNKGVVVVLRNPCTNSFTYLLGGPRPMFLW